MPAVEESGSAADSLSPPHDATSPDTTLGINQDRRRRTPDPQYTHRWRRTAYLAACAKRATLIDAQILDAFMCSVVVCGSNGSAPG